MSFCLHISLKTGLERTSDTPGVFHGKSVGSGVTEIVFQILVPYVMAVCGLG